MLLDCGYFWILPFLDFGFGMLMDCKNFDEFLTEIETLKLETLKWKR
jgi:hypothetical protein